MKNKILEILYDASIKNTGFCDYALIKEHLLPCRAISRIPEKASSVIICAFPYKVKEQRADKISRYAAVPDYHEIVMRYLEKAAEKLKAVFPDNRFECFCDNSPIPEIFCAAVAGLGVKGDNGLLITEEYGSWVFLGEIVTDITVESENKYRECLHCSACERACPKFRYKTDCLSQVSQKKRDLSEIEKTALIENSIIWGCDICAEVCPMNRDVKIEPLPEFIADYRNCYEINEDIKGRAYAWRGEKVIKRNFELLEN